MFFRKKDEDKTIVNSAPVDVDDANRDIAAEVDAMMKKFDLESNTRIWEGWQKWVVMTISACFAAYCICLCIFKLFRKMNSHQKKQKQNSNHKYQ